MPVISALVDPAITTFSTGQVLVPSVLNASISSLGRGVNRINDVLADLESHYAGTSQPNDKVAGKLWYDTATDRPFLDPDGNGADQAVGPRILKVDLTAVAQAGVTGTLITYSIPANTLKDTGKILRITCWGTNIGAIAAATIQFRLSAVSKLSSFVSVNTDAWRFVIYLIKTGSNTQDWFLDYTCSDTAGWDGTSAASMSQASFAFGTATETDTAAIAFDLNISVIEAAETVTQEGLLVELLN